MAGKKRGRPALTHVYLDAIRNTPKGEAAIMGKVPTGEAFASYQAAAHHQGQIKKALGNSAGKKTVVVTLVKDAIEDIEYSEERGRYVSVFEDGYYLVLQGRGKA